MSLTLLTGVGNNSRRRGRSVTYDPFGGDRKTGQEDRKRYKSFAVHDNNNNNNNATDKQRMRGTGE